MGHYPNSAEDVALKAVQSGFESQVPYHLQRPPFLPDGVYDMDWSYDPDQPPIVVYSPPLGMQSGYFYNFDFAGWHFNDSGLIGVDANYPNGSRKVGHIRLTAILHNPEGNAYFSYHNYDDSGFCSREYAAAWLIAHWYEHYMHTCPCQVNDEKPTRFRYACIKGLLLFLT
jgi:hypothetical protein